MSRKFSNAKNKGHFIKEWRKYRKMSQEEVAVHINMSRPNYNKIENGKLPYKQDNLEALSEVLDCSTAALISKEPGEDQELNEIFDQINFLPKEQQKHIILIIRIMINSFNSAQKMTLPVQGNEAVLTSFKYTIDDLSIKIHCPSCGEEIFKTVRELKTQSSFRCPSCKARIHLRDDGFRAGLDKLDRELTSLQSNIKNLS